MKSNPTWGKRIEAFRNEHDLFQAELAELLGASTASVGNWEKDNNTPTKGYQEKFEELEKFPSGLKKRIQELKEKRSPASRLNRTKGSHVHAQMLNDAAIGMTLIQIAKKHNVTKQRVQAILSTKYPEAWKKIKRKRGRQPAGK